MFIFSLYFLLLSHVCFFSSQAFPVEIIPNLYLGNASISAELSILERHNIKHILNVTPDLPNVFENSNIRYLQIPISDHWTQSMLHYFPSAIQFIGKFTIFSNFILLSPSLSHLEKNTKTNAHAAVGPPSPSSGHYNGAERKIVTCIQQEKCLHFSYV